LVVSLRDIIMNQTERRNNTTICNYCLYRML